MQNGVLIVDCGSQFTQLIGRKVRELNIYCQIFPYNNLPHSFENYSAIIISGSPYSTTHKDAPKIDLTLFKNKPILGICFGAQYIAKHFGGEVRKSVKREYGRARLSHITPCALFGEISLNTQVWMSHSDTIITLPKKAEKLISTHDVTNAGFKIQNTKIYGIQFHPEVYHTEEGIVVLNNFLTKIALIKPDWTSDNFIAKTVTKLKEQLANDKVILGLSGGVDSTVAATILNKAIGKNLYCVFVNNGLLRKNEFENVSEQYKQLGLNIKSVDALDLFISKLKNVSDPEKKRKIIGKTFIDVFDKEAKAIDGVKWLAQGTIYPDVIESISVKGPSATIKSHHNVGGLPKKMKLKIVEPLRTLFKDEVRRIGKYLGIKPEFLERHPFPGPGLAIRILGEVTIDRVKILQEADAIFTNALIRETLYNTVWQSGTMLLPIKTVGVMGDERTYESCVVIRAVESVDGMTADWANLPYEFLQNVSNEIINNVRGINRVVYDISSKPPATIEWE